MDDGCLEEGSYDASWGEEHGMDSMEGDESGSSGSSADSSLCATEKNPTNEQEIEERQFQLKKSHVEKTNRETERRYQKEVRLAAGKAALRYT